MVTKRKRNEAKRMGRLYSSGGGGGGSRGGGGGGKYNPFEYKHASSRFDVLGKTKGKRVQTKQGDGKEFRRTQRTNVMSKHDEGIRRREKSLLVEYQQRHSANTFMDRRFGEKDESLNEEDRAILRFQRERVRQAKRNRYALDDGEGDSEEDGYGYGLGEGEDLTHGGRKLDDFDDKELGGELDSDDGGDFGFVAKGSYSTDKEFENMMTEFQFGNGGKEVDGGEAGSDEEGERERKKTKKEIMQELIAKSKYFKGLKAKEKDEDETLRNKLDNEFKEIMQDQDTVAKMSRLRMLKKEQSLKQKSERKTEADAGYDKITEDLIFEFRQSGAQAQPTREEIARKAKQRLEELEKERQQMIEGKEELEDEDPDKVKGFRGRRMRQKLLEEEGGAGSTASFNERLRKKNSALEETGDDLGDDFVLSDDDQGDYDDDDSGDGSESSYYSESEESKEDEEGVVEGIEEDEEEPSKKKKADKDVEAERESLKVTGEEAYLRRANLGAKPKESDQHKASSSHRTVNELDSSIPYVIGIPKTYEEFDQLMEGRTPSQQAEILQRIRISNPVSMGPDNRKKVQAFYGILLQFFVNQCKACPLPRELLNVVVPEIHTVTSEVPLYASTVARARLSQMHKRLLRGMWPTKHMLGTLELFNHLFDPLQPSHPVLTPMLLVMSKWLLFTPTRSGVDVAKGLYLVKILKRYAEQSTVLVPECIKFLHSIAKQVKVDSTEPGLLVFPKKTKAIGKALKTSKMAVEDVLDADVSSDDVKRFETAPFKVCALNFAYKTTVDLCDMHKKLPSAPELFEPLAQTLRSVADDFGKSSYASEAKKLGEMATTLEEIILECKMSRPSLGNAFKEDVKQVKQFNPRFEEDYVAGKDYDIDRDRSERKRLRRELKRERRGAMRELRKDNKFLATVKNKETDAQKEELQKKYNKQFHFLEQQQSDFRSGGQKGTNFKKLMKRN
ncbi:nucleolar protein 14 [Chloropicon primus]|uniref:Nucleolar protein 14 n=2 Tax=Chloropicon primus TaxID=1764295 RepID=A0A5B8MZ42_9CHLO|nr:nucleolar protein 14 [Chloropicon primus]|eukprot:QDZ25907.1 nucleolar protein 14 [Chloropicon primus]